MTYRPLPSDGVPHVVDDGPTPADGPCRCVDCRCEKQVEAIMALELQPMKKADRRTR